MEGTDFAWEHLGHSVILISHQRIWKLNSAAEYDFNLTSQRNWTPFQRVLLKKEIIVYCAQLIFEPDQTCWIIEKIGR